MNATNEFVLQFEIDRIPELAAQYPVEYDREVEFDIAPQVQSRGYFTRPEFLIMCRLKTSRSKPRVERNSEDYIQEVTRIALTTQSERLKIEVLTLLEGVSWPTASLLLHYGCFNRYPILDFRALESLGVEAAKVQYNFDFWWKYVQFCRSLAAQAGVSMRTLDRALWKYSQLQSKPSTAGEKFRKEF